MTDVNNTEKDKVAKAAKPAKTTPEKPKKHKTGRGVAWLAFLLAIMTLCAVVYIGYQGILWQQKTSQDMSLLKTDYASYADSTSNYGQKIESQSQELHQLENKVASLTPNTYKMAQVNELITVANQMLTVYHDVPGTIHLLTSAQDMIQGDNDATLTQLKLALSNDIGQLSQLPVIDIVVLNGQLDSIDIGIDQMFLTYNKKVMTETKEPQESGSKWHLFISDLKHSLMKIVSIKKAHQGVVLMPNTENLFRQSLQIDVLNCKIALLNHDAHLWQYSLNDMKQKIQQYFMGYSQSSAVLTQVDELINTPIDLPNANIDATLKAIKKLNTL